MILARPGSRVRFVVVAFVLGGTMSALGATPAFAQDANTAAIPGSQPNCGGGGVGVAVAPGTSPDSDCDGLSDAQENYWHLDPYNRDGDGDGIGDGDEFYNVYVTSDPSRWDSDYDGLGDGQEVFNLGTDPWN